MPRTPPIGNVLLMIRSGKVLLHIYFICRVCVYMCVRVCVYVYERECECVNLNAEQVKLSQAEGAFLVAQIRNRITLRVCFKKVI